MGSSEALKLPNDNKLRNLLNSNSLRSFIFTFFLNNQITFFIFYVAIKSTITESLNDEYNVTLFKGKNRKKN